MHSFIQLLVFIVYLICYSCINTICPKTSVSFVLIRPMKLTRDFTSLSLLPTSTLVMAVVVVLVEIVIIVTIRIGAHTVHLLCARDFSQCFQSICLLHSFMKLIFLSPF